MKRSNHKRLLGQQERTGSQWSAGDKGKGISPFHCISPKQSSSAPQQYCSARRRPSRGDEMLSAQLPSLRHTAKYSQGKVDLHYQGSSALLEQTKQEIYTSKLLAWHYSNKHQVHIQAVIKITRQTQRTTLRLRETLLSCFSEEHHDSKC